MKIVTRGPARSIACAALLALAVAGCKPAMQSKYVWPAPVTVDALTSRLDAAQGMGDATARDAALERVASDASDSGTGEITYRALASMTDTNRRDRRASRCALRLSQSGSMTAANDIARTVGDPQLRDQTLNKLAAPKPEPAWYATWE